MKEDDNCTFFGLYAKKMPYKFYVKLLK